MSNFAPNLAISSIGTHIAAIDLADSLVELDQLLQRTLVTSTKNGTSALLIDQLEWVHALLGPQ